MATSKKDYVAIAAMLRDEREQFEGPNGDANVQHGASIAVASIQKKLAHYFESVNPAFDRARFEKACRP